MKLKKDLWTGLEHQSPNPKIEVFTKGIPDNADFIFSADPKAGAWSKLLAYSFSESVGDLEGSFSFSIENTYTGKGTNTFGSIPIRSIVKIYEGGEKPAFVGIIRVRYQGATMTAQGIRRAITFSGKSIISCIAEYTLSLDVRIQAVADAVSKNIDLTTKLAGQKLSIKSFMQITWEHFEKTSKQFGISTTGLADIIEKFIGGPGNFIEVTGKEQEIRYDVACIFYNATNNVIADVWRNILPKPVYEFFSRCEAGEPKIIARQVPFNKEDWSKLDIYEISPVSLTGYELRQSDEEVYTAFASYIIGSAMDRKFYLGVNQTGNDDIVFHDTEKQKIYGFKPLEIDFHGYDRQGNENEEWNEKKPKLKDALRALNEMAAYWYSRLDEMYSGTLSICTDFKNPKTNPRAGCRAKFMGGEFYIEKAEHNWKLSGTPIIKLTVSRGMCYDYNSGTMLWSLGMGTRFQELSEGFVPAVEVVSFVPAEKATP